ncbi:hypothetical protein [Ruegeria arenilitoris]|uniref:hypothetical protein n=1 Tax=Ruegeria arenilitoris TaxID=1173585 RepID=UPI00147C4EFD|nr:hypothetical protein [Ruegeria arenilitoris]
MNPRHLLRMSMLVRKPPSERRVLMVFGIIAVCLIVGGIEYLGWWPEWATSPPQKLRP